MSQQTVRQGWVRTTSQRMSKANKWADRYFVLQGPVLYFYLKNTDTEPKGTLVLQEACKVSDIRSDVNKKRKQFVFSITWPAEHDTDEKDEASNQKDAAGADGADSPPKHSQQLKEKKRFLSRSKGKTDDTNGSKKNDNGQLSGRKVAALTVGGVAVGALTAGIGLIAGMMVVGMGAAGGGGALALSRMGGDKDKEVFLACESYHDAEMWVQAIEAQLRSLGDNVLGMTYVPSHIPSHVGSRRHAPPPEVRIDEGNSGCIPTTHLMTHSMTYTLRHTHSSTHTLCYILVEEWISSSRWRVWSVRDGIRLFEQTFDEGIGGSSSGFSSGAGGFTSAFLGLGNPHHGSSSSSSASGSSGSTDLSSPPCLRINIPVNGSALDVFMAVMNLPPACRTGAVKSIRVVESINNYTDVVHIVLDSAYTFPTWTAPRDLCLMRYWKHNTSDGSYVVCMDSTFHLDCPLMAGHVRGDLHAVYLISPPKLGGGQEGDYDDEHTECMLTFIAQLDPRGWIWRRFGYQHEVLTKLMLHVLDIRDALDMDRFVQVHFDPNSERSVLGLKSSIKDSNNKDETASGGNSSTSNQGNIGTIPPPILPREYWSDIDASSFKVRGKTYNQDRNKIASASSLFKLVAIDVFEVPEPTFNIAEHPNNRVHLAHQRGEDTWVFVMHIMIPGQWPLPFLVLHFNLADCYHQVM